MHILRVTGIHYRDGVALYRVRKVLLVCVRHVVARPTRDGRFPSQQRPLNLVHRKDCIMCIPFHIVLIVSVAVFLRHILIEREYLTRCPRPNDIVHVSLMHR